MPKITLEYTAVSYIRDEAIDLAKPLLAMTSLIVKDIRERVMTTGMDAAGNKFSPYAIGTIRERKRLGLQTAYKDFSRSHTMWNSLKVKLRSPANAGAVFTGRAAHGRVKGKRRKVGPKGGKTTLTRLTNARLARILSFKEQVPIMHGRLSEVEKVLPLFGDVLTGKILTAIGLEEQSYALQARVRKAQRTVNKALQMRRTHGIPPAKAYGRKKARRSRRKFGLHRLLSPKGQLPGERKIYTNTFG